MPPEDNILNQIITEQQSVPAPNVLDQRPPMAADYAAQVQQIQASDALPPQPSTQPYAMPTGPISTLARAIVPGYDRAQEAAQLPSQVPSTFNPIDPSIYADDPRPSAAPTTTEKLTDTTGNRSVAAEAALAKGNASVTRQGQALDALTTNLDANTKEAKDLQAKYDKRMEDLLVESTARSAKLTKESDDYKGQLNQQRLDALKIKPEDFWQDSSTGQKVAMSLAIMAGGLSQGLARNPNGPNPASESLKNAVNQDMQKYAAKMQAATSGMDATGKMIDVVSKQIGDANVGYALHKVILGDQLKGTLDTLERQANNEKAKGEIARIKGELEQQQIKNVVNYEQTVAGTLKRDYEIKRLVSNVAPESHAQLKALTPAEQSKLLVSVDQKNKIQAKIMGVDPMTLPAYTIPANATEAQQKALKFANASEIDVYRMENTEKSLAPEKMNALRLAIDIGLKDNLSGDKSPSVLGINLGKTYEEWQADFGGGIIANAEKAAGPAGAAYARALLSFSNDNTRDFSGAAIQKAEHYATAVQKAFMAPELDATGQRDVKNQRRAWTEAVINIATQGQQRAPAHLTSGK